VTNVDRFDAAERIVLTNRNAVTSNHRERGKCASVLAARRIEIQPSTQSPMPQPENRHAVRNTVVG
jgi:hypothetical protein